MARTMIDGVQTTSVTAPAPAPKPVNTNTPTTSGSTYLDYQNQRSTVTSPPRTVTSAPAPAPVSPAPPAAPVAVPPATPPPPGTTSGLPTDGQPTPTSTYDDSAYRAAREAELAAALKALESQFNLSREELLADQTEAGDQYRFIMSALQRSKEEAILGAQSGALQRGVLRSGIYLGDEAKVNQQFASQESAAAADKAAKLNAIQQAIAQLEGQFATGQAATATGTVQAQLASMKELANSLALDDALGQRATAAGYTPAPLGPTGASALGGGSVPNTTDAFLQRQQLGQQFGIGDFVDSRPSDQVIGGGGGQQVFGPGSPTIIPNTVGNQQGQAYFGQGVDPTSFYNSLSPEVQRGITPQDLLNIAEFYGGVIPSDAAYGIASRAALIGNTSRIAQ